MTCTARVIPQSAHDKVPQLRPWCCLCGPSYIKDALRKLHLIRRDGVDRNLCLCAPHVYLKVFPRVSAYSRVVLLSTLSMR